MKQLLLLGLLLSTSAVYGQIIVDENESTGEISYMTSLLPLKTEGVLPAHAGIVHTENGVFGFIVQIHTNKILRLNDDVIYFNIDGNRREFDLHSIEHNNNTERQYALTFEQRNFIIDKPLVKSISEAENARFIIGLNSYEFTLSAKIRTRLLLEKIEMQR